jgi:hypothetical protein
MKGFAFSLVIIALFLGPVNAFGQERSESPKFIDGDFFAISSSQAVTLFFSRDSTQGLDPRH